MLALSAMWPRIIDIYYMYYHVAIDMMCAHQQILLTPMVRSGYIFEFFILVVSEIMNSVIKVPFIQLYIIK